VTAEVIRLGIPTKVDHEPDYILEAAKGNGLEAVLVIGWLENGEFWFSGSTGDMERVVFLLERAKRKAMDLVVADEPETRGDAS
jgi:hypothetical protein